MLVRFFLFMGLEIHVVKNSHDTLQDWLETMRALPDFDVIGFEGALLPRRAALHFESLFAANHYASDIPDLPEIPTLEELNRYVQELDVTYDLRLPDAIKHRKPTDLDGYTLPLFSFLFRNRHRVVLAESYNDKDLRKVERIAGHVNDWESQWRIDLDFDLFARGRMDALSPIVRQTAARDKHIGKACVDTIPKRIRRLYSDLTKPSVSYAFLIGFYHRAEDYIKSVEIIDAAPHVAYRDPVRQSMRPGLGFENPAVQASLGRLYLATLAEIAFFSGSSKSYGTLQAMGTGIDIHAIFEIAHGLASHIPDLDALRSLGKDLSRYEGMRQAHNVMSGALRGYFKSNGIAELKGHKI